MRERLKHKYALSEQGVNDMIKAVIIVTIANLAFMVPVGLLYLLASDILNGGIPSSKLPMYIGGMVISILLIIITTYFQYNATFLATYVESGVRRRTLAEKLRKIPLSFFGKKDLADLKYDHGRLCMAGNSKFSLFPTVIRFHVFHNDRNDLFILFQCKNDIGSCMGITSCIFCCIRCKTNFTPIK